MRQLLLAGSRLLVFRGPMSPTTSEDGTEPDGDRPDDLDKVLSQRREEISDRIEELHEREQQIADRLSMDRRTDRRSSGSLPEAEVHAAEAKAHVQDGHAHAAQA